MATLAAEELERRKKLKDEKMKRDEEEEEETEEAEKRRKVEQDQLKEKLAQEGMGDVTVVLPDAPPPDDAADIVVDIDGPTDLSLTAGPPSGIGFMARKAVSNSALMTDQFGHVLQAQYGPDDEAKQATQVRLFLDLRHSLLS